MLQLRENIYTNAMKICRWQNSTTAYILISVDSTWKYYNFLEMLQLFSIESLND